VGGAHGEGLEDGVAGDGNDVVEGCRGDDEARNALRVAAQVDFGSKTKYKRDKYKVWKQ
jgi:hypothetical protein